MSFTDDEIMQKIYELRNSFVMKYNLKPNAVYIGYDEYYILKEYARIAFSQPMPEETVFGMKIERVLKDEHLSVGLVIG